MRRCRVLLAAFAALLLVVAAACGGGSGGGEPPAPLVRPVEALAERLFEDDLPLARSSVVVRFDSAVEPLTLRVFHQAFRLSLPPDSPLEGHPLAEMPIERVEITGEDVVELTVSALIANGAILTVDTSFFGEGGEEVAVPVVSEFTELGVVLAGGVFVFSDFSIVAVRDPETPTADDRDPALVRAALETHLDKRGASAAVREAALRVYDGADPAIVPAPKVRAALGALVGTFANAAVASLLGSENCTGEPAAFIGFQEPPDNPELAARVTYDDAGRRVISIRPDLEAAPFELLMPLLVHEAVHCDQFDSLEEEIVASAIDVFLYIHLLISRPELAYDSSPLARNFNIEALAMLNSGRARPESLGILASPHEREVLPESGFPQRSFAAFIASVYADEVHPAAPTEATAQQYLDALAEATGAPPGDAFDLDYVDFLLGYATSLDAIATLLALFDLEPA